MKSTKIEDILADEIEEAMLSRMNVIAQNGNTGEHYEESL